MIYVVMRRHEFGTEPVCWWTTEEKADFICARLAAEHAAEHHHYTVERVPHGAEEWNGS